MMKATKKKENEDMNLSRFANATPTERARLAKLFARAALLSLPEKRPREESLTKDEKEPNK
jgi:hypothetical protein